MYAYPATLDAEQALLVVYKRVTGTPTPAAELANACWVLLGFGLNLSLPEVSMSAMSTAVDPGCDLAKELAFVGKPHTSKLGDGTLLKLIPWKVVLPLLLQLLQGVLAGK